MAYVAFPRKRSFDVADKPFIHETANPAFVPARPTFCHAVLLRSHDCRSTEAEDHRNSRPWRSTSAGPGYYSDRRHSHCGSRRQHTSDGEAGVRPRTRGARASHGPHAAGAAAHGRATGSPGDSDPGTTESGIAVLSDQKKVADGK